jgi:phenylacetate-CoA ligase
VLPNGSHVGLYKDALYADHSVAGAVTGAVRLIVTDRQCTMHVQLVPGATPSTFLEQRIVSSVPRNVQPSRVVLWPYAQFPFGMTLDYERKFPYYLSGEPEPAREPLLA